MSVDTTRQDHLRERRLYQMRRRAEMARQTRINLVHVLHRQGKPVSEGLAAKVCPVFVYLTGGVS